jgi:NADH-quinone oxidoreductase subunit A
MQLASLPILLFAICAFGLAVALLILARVFNPSRPGNVKRMPYESGMDPIHDTHRRFDIRFYLLAIAFLVFDVELLFLYPWAVSTHPASTDKFQNAKTVENSNVYQFKTISVPHDAVKTDKNLNNRDIIFAGAMLFIFLLALGFVYDWRKGIFQWH